MDEYGICYLKKTDQSIFHILKREGHGGGSIQDVIWDLVQFHPELRLQTTLLPVSVPGSSWTWPPRLRFIIISPSICFTLTLKLPGLLAASPMTRAPWRRGRWEHARAQPLSQGRFTEILLPPLQLLTAAGPEYFRPFVTHNRLTQVKSVWQTQTLTATLLSPSAFVGQLTPQPGLLALPWTQWAPADTTQSSEPYPPAKPTKTAEIGWQAGWSPSQPSDVTWPLFSPAALLLNSAGPGQWWESKNLM